MRNHVTSVPIFRHWQFFLYACGTTGRQQGSFAAGGAATVERGSAAGGAAESQCGAAGRAARCWLAAGRAARGQLGYCRQEQ
jgi:hypothetical protein